MFLINFVTFFSILNFESFQNVYIFFEYIVFIIMPFILLYNLTLEFALMFPYLGFFIVLFVFVVYAVVLFLLVVYAVVGSIILYDSDRNMGFSRYGDFPDINPPNNDSWWKSYYYNIRDFYYDNKTAIIVCGTIIAVGGISIYLLTKGIVKPKGTVPPNDISPFNPGDDFPSQFPVTVQSSDRTIGLVLSGIENIQDTQSTTVSLNLDDSSTICLKYFRTYYNSEQIIKTFFSAKIKDDLILYQLTDLFDKIRKDCLHLPCISSEQHNKNRLETLSIFLHYFKLFTKQFCYNVEVINQIDNHFDQIEKFILENENISDDFEKKKYPEFLKLLSSINCKNNLYFPFSNPYQVEDFLVTFLPLKIFDNPNLVSNLCYVEKNVIFPHLNEIRANIIINKKFDLMYTINFMNSLDNHNKMFFFQEYFLPVLLNDVLLIANNSFLIDVEEESIQQLLLSIKTCRSNPNDFYTFENMSTIRELISILLRIRQSNSNFAIEPFQLITVDFLLRDFKEILF